jgi:hypothetical protein
MAREPVKVVVVMQGGCLVGWYADLDVDLIVFDHDDQGQPIDAAGTETATGVLHEEKSGRITDLDPEVLGPISEEWPEY